MFKDVLREVFVAFASSGGTAASGKPATAKKARRAGATGKAAEAGAAKKTRKAEVARKMAGLRAKAAEVRERERITKLALETMSSHVATLRAVNRRY